MLNTEAAKRLGLLETSKGFDRQSPKQTLKQISDAAYSLRMAMDMTRDVLSQEIGVSEEELATLETGTMIDVRRAQEIVILVRRAKDEYDLSIRVRV